MCKWRSYRQHKHILSNTKCPVLLIIQTAQTHTVSRVTQTVQYCWSYRQHKHILSHTNCPVLLIIQAAQTHTVSHKLSSAADHTDSKNTYCLTQSAQYCCSFSTKISNIQQSLNSPAPNLIYWVFIAMIHIIKWTNKSTVVTGTLHNFEYK